MKWAIHTHFSQNMPEENNQPNQDPTSPVVPSNEGSVNPQEDKTNFLIKAKEYRRYSKEDVKAFLDQEQTAKRLFDKFEEITSEVKRKYGEEGLKYPRFAAEALVMLVEGLGNEVQQMLPDANFGTLTEIAAFTAKAMVDGAAEDHAERVGEKETTRNNWNLWHKN